MAESEKYSQTVFEESDVKDIYCEPCNKAGNVAIAEGYCVDCPEYLCGPCYKSHQQQRDLANHVLLDKDSMPIAIHSIRRVLDCDKKCPIHTTQVIELFCETCDKLVCHICVTTDHCQCKKVKHISDIVKDLEHTKEFQKLHGDIQSTANAFSEHEEKLKANVTSNNEMKRLAKQELKCQRAKVNSFFHQLEKKMDEQITDIQERNKDTLIAASDKLDSMKRDFDEIKNDIEAKNTGQKCGQFIAMKQIQEKLRYFHDQFDKMQKELRIQNYKLVPSEQIQAMMTSTTEICRKLTARFESVTDIKTSTDKTEPFILAITPMHEHYCVASDTGNRKLKVIDTNSKCVTSEITVEAADIFSVTSVSDDQVALSVSLSNFKEQMKIFTVSASGVIQPTSQLFNANDCYCSMVYSAGNIYGLKPHRIDKLSTTEKITTIIHTDKEGDMERIAISPDGQTLYVTDSRKNSITSMTLGGKVKAVYKDKDLKYPRGITVDKHGYVYVCSWETNNIQQLTADLHKVQVLIDGFSDVITYSSMEHKLYTKNCNQLHQYSLDFK